MAICWGEPTDVSQKQHLMEMSFTSRQSFLNVCECLLSTALLPDNHQKMISPSSFRQVLRPFNHGKKDKKKPKKQTNTQAPSMLAALFPVSRRKLKSFLTVSREMKCKVLAKCFKCCFPADLFCCHFAFSVSLRVAFEGVKGHLQNCLRKSCVEALGSFESSVWCVLVCMYVSVCACMSVCSLFATAGS